MKVTDEGQRFLKASNIPIKRRNTEHVPLIQPYSSTSVPPPLISQPVPKCRLTASPRGKPGAVTFNFHHPSNRSVPPACGRMLSAPTIRVGSHLHSTNRSVAQAGGSTASRPLQGAVHLITNSDTKVPSEQPQTLLSILSYLSPRSGRFCVTGKRHRRSRIAPAICRFCPQTG